MNTNNIREIVAEDFFNLSNPKEKIIFLLRYAIFAPSTHNCQPWLFKIEESSCKIYYDPKKEIKEADPVERDLYISFGCLIENLVIAARYFNVFEKVSYQKRDSNNLIGEVFFKNLNRKQASSDLDESIHRLISIIPKRVNSRGIFEKKEVPRNLIDKYQNLNNSNRLELKFISEKNKIDALARLTERGLHIAYNNPTFRKEMSGWINSSFSKRPEGIPGYSLRMPSFISLIFSRLVRYLNIGKKVGKLNYMSISSAPLITIISSDVDDPLTWLETGRLAEKMMLEARSDGLKTSIFIASIEMDDLYKEVQKLIVTTKRPQFLMCIGYMDFNQKPNLRHPVESKLIG